MKRVTLLILVLFTFAAPRTLKAQDNVESWFEQATVAYNDGRYSDALDLYDRIIKEDVESAALYYNMGNAYYKKQDFPMAIYYYERALKIDPSIIDAKVNLEIANLAIADKIDPLPQSFIAKGWNNLKNLFSGNVWAVLSIVAFALMLLSAFLFLRARRMGARKLGFFLGLLMVLAMTFSVIFSAQKRSEGKNADHAIVMTPTVTVKSSPNTSSVDLFVLHEGTKVTILDEADGWNKIRIANGSEGWLPADASLPF